MSQVSGGLGQVGFEFRIRLFVFGTGPTDFEFTFDTEALRHFVTTATQALQEMDHLHALYEAGEPVPDEPATLTVTGQPER